jgi:hypothetical protein
MLEKELKIRWHCHADRTNVTPIQERRNMGLILLILVILFLFGGGGYYGYRSGYYGGRGFGGSLGLVVLIIVLVLLFGDNAAMSGASGSGLWGLSKSAGVS